MISLEQRVQRRPSRAPMERATKQVRKALGMDPDWADEEHRKAALKRAAIRPKEQE
eukprot:CAMPEP_0202958488 /NCGR_PEP_ID=MMETSP1396-20130829/2826_1 /ASSEMBLY_ACC=CAM_ASM_000872 /TAXON_ID= /ORGANISM="Pseudokeronopsis sp., Strain Brazil" /LENGTH=55 /DNA_ID=CAMNT_0049676593 /DNA_START=257 /DNA_END=424 /DNA_ORIENTATION=-